MKKLFYLMPFILLFGCKKESDEQKINLSLLTKYDWQQKDEIVKFWPSLNRNVTLTFKHTYSFNPNENTFVEKQEVSNGYLGDLFTTEHQIITDPEYIEIDSTKGTFAVNQIDHTISFHVDTDWPLGFTDINGSTDINFNKTIKQLNNQNLAFAENFNPTQYYKAIAK